MSRFWKAFHKGRIGQLTDEELMVYGKRKGPSWAAGRGRWVTPERGYTGYTGGRARRMLKLGYARSFNTRSLARTGGYRASYRGGEKKFHDISVTKSGVTQAGEILNGGSIALIGQGTGESLRIGRKLTIKSILWKWNLKRIAFAGSTAPPGETVRMILYQDTQTNGATATTALILQSDNYQSFKNLENGARFRILYDKTITLNDLSGAGDGAVNDFPGVVRNGTFYKNCNIVMEFKGTDTPAIITNVRTNNLGILLISEQGGIADLDSQIRLRFTG